MPMLINYPVVEIFGLNAGGAYINLPIPVPSQIGTTPGAASFNDAFPPVTFIDPLAGGTPPSGKDINGVLYMLSQYAAGLQAGLLCAYSAAVSTAIGGYAKGAMLGKASGVGFWISTVNANVTDPDTGGAGWQDFSVNAAGYDEVVPANGANNNYALPGPTYGFVDLNPAAACNITGIVAGFNGQTVTFTNVSAFNVTINSLNGGSSAANQIRLVADTILTQNSSITLRYSTTLALWVLV